MKKKTTNPSPANDRVMKHDMSLDEIQELIKMLGKSNVSEISIERKNFKITLRTHNPHGPAQAASQMPVSQPMQQHMIQTESAPAPAKESASKTEAPKTEYSDDSKYITIKSPMIGTFYRSSSPDKPPFVNVGDEIKEGTVLCVIEAMKLFNEIESEVKGKIVKVLVEDASPVEYDQPLFLVDPA